MVRWTAWLGAATVAAAMCLPGTGCGALKPHDNSGGPPPEHEPTDAEKASDAKRKRRDELQDEVAQKEDLDRQRQELEQRQKDLEQRQKELATLDEELASQKAADEKAAAEKAEADRKAALAAAAPTRSYVTIKPDWAELDGKKFPSISWSLDEPQPATITITDGKVPDALVSSLKKQRDAVNSHGGHATVVVEATKDMELFEKGVLVALRAALRAGFAKADVQYAVQPAAK